MPRGKCMGVWGKMGKTPEIRLWDGSLEETRDLTKGWAAYRRVGKMSLQAFLLYFEFSAGKLF